MFCKSTKWHYWASNPVTTICQLSSPPRQLLTSVPPINSLVAVVASKAGRRCKFAIFRKSSEWRGRVAKNWLCFVNEATTAKWRSHPNWLCSANRQNRVGSAENWLCSANEPATVRSRLRSNWLRSANRGTRRRSPIIGYCFVNNPTPTYQRSYSNWLCSANRQNPALPNNWLCSEKPSAPSQPSCKVEKDHAQPRSGDTRS
jgi:hypothetical protein